MSERSGFFDAQLVGEQYDRIYSSLDFSSLFSTFFRNGVFVSPSNCLQVVANDGLTVTVRAGKAFIDGYWYVLEENLNISFSVNSTSNTIINTVVCQLNRTTRTIKTIKKEQVSDTKPIDNGTITELVLCTIELGVGVSEITNSMIKDTRPDASYCGFVAGTVEQIDALELFTKFEEQFEQWFNKVKGQLSEDEAYDLQTQIGDLNDLRTIAKTDLITALNEVYDIAERVNSISNPNLLINSDFQIWQRGTNFTSSNAEKYVYTADRWCIFSATGRTLNCSKVSNGLQFSVTDDGNVLSQILEQKLKVGENYVLSAMIDGVVYEMDIVGGTYENSDNGRLGYHAYGSDYERINIIPQGTTTVSWVKLEQGTIRTLHASRTYAEELLLCKRYFYVIPPSYLVGSLKSDRKTLYIQDSWAGNHMREAKTVSTATNLYVSSANGGGSSVTAISWSLNSICLTANGIFVSNVAEQSLNSEYRYVPSAIGFSISRDIVIDAEIY